MLQRWMKTLVVLVSGTLLFAACKKEYSTDEPFPEVFNPLLYITTQNEFLYALEPATGNKKWEYYVGSHVTGVPVILGDYLFVPTRDSILKMDAKRGKFLRSYNKMAFPEPGNPNNIIDVIASNSSLAGKGVMLYVGTNNGKLTAIDVNEDKVKWRYNAGVDIASVISPTIYEDALIYSVDEGKVASVNINNGTKNWEFTGAMFTSAPTVSNGEVFVGCVDKSLYCFNAKTGVVKWTYATGGRVESSPIAYGGYVIFGSSDNKLYCIDTVARTPIWVFNTGDRILSSPVADRNVVYVGSYDHNFYAINIIDGTEKWRIRTKALITSSPLLHEKTLYFGGHDKNLYAVDTNGYMRWTHNTNGILESSPILWDLTQTYYPSVSGMSKN